MCWFGAAQMWLMKPRFQVNWMTLLLVEVTVAHSQRRAPAICNIIRVCRHLGGHTCRWVIGYLWEWSQNGWNSESAPKLWWTKLRGFQAGTTIKSPATLLSSYPPPLFDHHHHHHHHHRHHHQVSIISMNLQTHEASLLSFTHQKCHCSC